MNKIYINVNELGQIIALGTHPCAMTPHEHVNEALDELNKIEGFYLENGVVKYSEQRYLDFKNAQKEAEAVKQAEANLEYLKNKEVLDALDDESALLVSALYPKWKADIYLKAGTRVQDEEVLYKVLTAHRTQEDWKPKDSPSLFAKVLVEDPEAVSVWEQPESTNGYSKGNKVSHNGVTYESLVGNNVWEPGAVGTESVWQKVEEQADGQ